jgi:hypothetical protein
MEQARRRIARDNPEDHATRVAGYVVRWHAATVPEKLGIHLHGIE